MVLLGLAMFGIVSADAQDNGLSLDLKFDGPKAINAGGETIKLDGALLQGGRWSECSRDRKYTKRSANPCANTGWRKRHDNFHFYDQAEKTGK